MLKRSCLALAAAVLSLVPSLPVFAQSALTNQDIEYLGTLHKMLLGDEDFDLSPAVNEIANDNKVALAKEFCGMLEDGNTFDQMVEVLYNPETTAATTELTEYQRNATRKYLMTAWFVGVKTYCPKYDYQLRAD